MTHNDFIVEQFISLRRDIAGQQARLFWIVVLGLLGLPLLGCLMLDASNRSWLTLPLLAFVLIMIFLSQQSRMLRTRSYVREFLEGKADFSPGWESWLEARRQYRKTDDVFFACFVVVFFVYYFLSIALALYRLWIAALQDPSGTYWWDFFGAAGVYAVTTVCGFAALLSYWKSTGRTVRYGESLRAPEPPKGTLVSRSTGSA